MQEKDALAQSVVHGALNCGILPEDDPSYLSCKADDVPEPYVDFMKVVVVVSWATLKNEFNVLLVIRFVMPMSGGTGSIAP